MNTLQKFHFMVASTNRDSLASYGEFVLFFCILVITFVVSGCSMKIIPSSPSPTKQKQTTTSTKPGKPRKTSKPYTIMGKKYYPLKEAKGFTETGMASWYGPKFHGRLTANGERYNMYAMTAAHRVLPFQTKLRVTNLQNGKSVIVRVNDRGPFAKNRILDLSYTAAKKLGVVGPGTAKVRIESLDTWKEDIPGVFYVQTGSYSVKKNALHQSRILKGQGYTQSRVVSAIIKGKRYWRVQAGTFNGLKAAQRAQQKLLKKYPSSFILTD